jgi:hypothetical protein
MSQPSGARPGLPARLLLLAGAALAIIGIAWWATGVGSWVGRPTGPPTPQTLPTLPTVSLPPVQPPQVDPPSGGDGWLRWVLIVLAAVLVVALLVLLFFWWRGRSGRHRPDADEVDEAPPALPDPRAEFSARAAADAVIACWLWVEDGAAAVGRPRGSSQTPTEFLAGLQAAVPLPPAAGTLLSLYHHARSDPAALDPSSAPAALDAAQQIRAALAVLSQPSPAGSDVGAGPAW